MDKKIIFFDSISGANHNIILLDGIGASEYQLYSLIKHISEKFTTICFNKTDNEYNLDKISYKPLNNFVNYEIDKTDIIVFQRVYLIDDYIINKLKYNLKYIWCHDIFNIGILTGYNKIIIEKCENNIVLFKEYLYSEFVNNPFVYFICTSNFGKEGCINFFLNYNIELNEKKCIMIYNILYEEEFLPIKNIIDCKIDKNLIVYASAWYKGIDKILNMFAILYDKDNELKLALLTPGYDINIVNYYSPLIKEKFKDSVIIYGKQNKHNYCKIIKSALCVLSPRFKETFGCVFAESYYIGTPVIADIQSGAVNEIIDNSYIINYDNIDEIYEKIIFLKENRDSINITLRNEMLFDHNFNLWCNLFTESTEK